MIVRAAVCDICGEVYTSTDINEKNVVFDTNNDFGIGTSRAVITNGETRGAIDICDACRTAIQDTINRRSAVKTQVVERAKYTTPIMERR